MQSRNLIRIIVVFLIAFSAFKFMTYKTNISSDKNVARKFNNFILQSGVIGLCLGVGVGSALKEMFSENVILLAGIIGATIGVVIGIIIRKKGSI